MNYPAGVTQASFDSETERINYGEPQLGTHEAEDPQALLRLEMSLHPERFMRKTDVEKIVRVLMALERQVDKQKVDEDRWALCRMIGRLMSTIGIRCYGEL